MFGFVPSITSVARQSLFSGKLPAEHPRPFSLKYEERQWREYWRAHGWREEEIWYGKGEAPAIPGYAKVAGVVVNAIDDLMHSEIQGGAGMLDGVTAWMAGGALERLLCQLLQMGFQVFLTSDHGNAEAAGQGRFDRPGIVTESASRRAVIYPDYDNAQELDKFAVMEYTGTYMPCGYRYFAFEQGCCYGNQGVEYISHGGMTIEEMIVPFARIGERRHG